MRTRSRDGAFRRVEIDARAFPRRRPAPPRDRDEWSYGSAAQRTGSAPYVARASGDLQRSNGMSGPTGASDEEYMARCQDCSVATSMTVRSDDHMSSKLLSRLSHTRGNCVAFVTTLRQASAATSFGSRKHAVPCRAKLPTQSTCRRAQHAGPATRVSLAADVRTVTVTFKLNTRPNEEGNRVPLLQPRPARPWPPRQIPSRAF